MSGLNAVLDVLLAERAAGRESVLATVVKVEGSAYRRPGARMLVSRQGRSEGTISGGCLEADVVRKAWWQSEDGPVVRRYSTAEDDEDGEEALSFGLGCNGKVYVLFERVSASGHCDLIEALINSRDTQQAVAIATVIGCSDSCHARVGGRLIVDSGGAEAGELLSSPLGDLICQDLKGTLARGKSSLRVYQQGTDHLEVFLEYVPAVRRLVVFGGGHDAQPLVRMGKLLGWHVTVVDSRANFAKFERFPDADQVLLGDIRRPFAYQNLVRGAAVAVMTHSLAQDAHWLEGVLQSEPGYVGQLGPRDRTERLLAGMRERLGELKGTERLHYPIGLDLGGDTPESIAMAILAEVQASLNGRSGSSLKLRSEPIHEHLTAS